MSAKRHMSSLGRCLLGFSYRTAICRLAAFLLLGGMVFATPISSMQHSALQDSELLANYWNNHSETKTLGFTSNASVVSALSPERSVSSAKEIGIFANSRYTTVKVPEPQSLVLVGTGLLSMAGFIRRRLLR
jgi:hypothetical protein